MSAPRRADVRHQNAQRQHGIHARRGWPMALPRWPAGGRRSPLMHTQAADCTGPTTKPPGCARGSAHLLDLAAHQHSSVMLAKSKCHPPQGHAPPSPPSHSAVLFRSPRQALNRLVAISHAIITGQREADGAPTERCMPKRPKRPPAPCNLKHVHVPAGRPTCGIKLLNCILPCHAG